jgi:plasmid stabilization system protein ParE
VRALRWTEHAVAQLATVAEYVSLSSPVYAEHLVDRIARRLDQAREFPESGRVVAEFARQDVRELIEWPYRLVYCVHADAIEIVSVLHGRQELRELP